MVPLKLFNLNPMKEKTLKTVCLYLLTLVPLPVFSQFSLTGEFRPRTELSHGYKTLAANEQESSLSTIQRSRLNLSYQNDKIASKLVLQDVRLWGGQAQLVANEDFAISLHEAWTEVFFTPEFSLKAGRQEVGYDDHRILGTVGWSQQGRSHDLAILKYHKNFTAHFGFAHHENGTTTDNLFNGPDAYKNLQYLWLNKKWGQNSLSILFLNDGKPAMEGEEQITRYTQTLGGHAEISVNPLSIASNFYYQTGKMATAKEVSAINFLIEISGKPGKNILLTGGYEYLSGTAPGNSETNHSFTPFYGTNHKFNGYMDYFYVGNHLNSVGLNDVYLKYTFSKNKISVNEHLHFFAAAQKPDPEKNSFLGLEFDFSVGWKINDAAKLDLGYSQLYASETMELIKGGDRKEPQRWAYLMLSVTPSFIK